MVLRRKGVLEPRRGRGAGEPGRGRHGAPKDHGAKDAALQATPPGRGLSRLSGGMNRMMITDIGYATFAAQGVVRSLGFYAALGIHGAFRLHHAGGSLA